MSNQVSGAVPLNRDVTVYESAARTATPAAVEFANYSGKSLVVVWNISAVSSTPSLVLTIDALDDAGVVYNILTSAAKTTAVATILRVSPDLTAATNLVAKDIVPRRVRITVTHGNTDSATYTVNAILSQ